MQNYAVQGTHGRHLNGRNGHFRPEGGKEISKPQPDLVCRKGKKKKEIKEEVRLVFLNPNNHDSGLSPLEKVLLRKLRSQHTIGPFTRKGSRVKKGKTFTIVENSKGITLELPHQLLTVS